MTDTNTANLCEQIISTHFGPLTAVRTIVFINALHTLNLSKIVAHVLLHHGRLPFGQIIRFSGLKPRTARAAIIVLVQHNILWHAQSDADGEVFEVNTDECLLRLRYGRFVWQAQQLHGKAVRTWIPFSTGGAHR